MSFRINSNIEAINTQRQLGRVSQTLSRSFERLSSGLRINSARDDAAGLAITDRFSAQIRSLTQSVRNANDGISMAQVAESAMAEETNILLRMRELSVQAANDTNTTADRTSIQAEVEQLKAELDRIGNNSQFNNMNILDGTMSDAYFHVGAHASQTISMTFWDSRSTALGATASITSNADVDANAIAAGDVQIDGVTIDASVALDDTKSTANANASAIAKAAAINKTSGQHGVVARAEATDVTGAAVGAGSLAAGGLVINNIDVGIVNNILANDADGRLTAAINAKAAATGVTATLAAGAITLTAVDGRNITTTTTAAGQAIVGFGAAGGSTDTTLGRITLSDDESFVLAGGNVAARIGIAAQTVNVDFTDVVSTITLTTRTGANDALAILDTAINQVASRRGDLGAVQNRLQSTVSNLEAVVENLSSARSRIRDADFAAETAEMTRSQILQQASTSMLAQANQAPQGVLSLLRG